jgi:uncharacterized protein YdiU (UPF0061 family)
MNSSTAPVSPRAARTLETLAFDNTYARLPEAFHSRLAPTPFAAPPYLVAGNPAAAALLDLDPGELRRPEFVEYASGRRALPGAEPVAMVYAGHQFGVYVRQLGDGRAILLGEVRNEAGEKWDLHLKGAGRTPYARDGDGRAVLRSSIREYLCCEAMHGLGIPTTRALSIVGSDEPVWRETIETAATIIRLAPTHVRFGSFEVFYYRRQYEQIRVLAEYIIAQHFPQVAGAADPYSRLFEEVAARTADLIAQWQAVGFAHGVMNTDNMSIVGLTLDYGPYGFMEAYDPAFICNHSDHHGRYAFDRQPSIALWNLSCLAQALLPLSSFEPLKAALDAFMPRFDARLAALMRAKLGLETAQPDDPPLVDELLDLMRVSRADYTMVFRALCEAGADGEPPGRLRDQFVDRERFDGWWRRYRDRVKSDGGSDAERQARMRRTNPKFILRNHLAQHAIERARQRDYGEIDRLLALLMAPYDEHPGFERYAEPPPDSAPRIAVSCSS